MNIVWMRPDKTIAVTLLTDEFVLAMRQAADCLAQEEKEQDRNLVDQAKVFADLNGLSAEQHAAALRQSGRVPLDWILVGVDVALPDRGWRDAWVWGASGIEVSLPLARTITKERLRSERDPLLTALDVRFQRNLESGADNSAIIAEKQRLRNITALADSVASLEELATLTCN